MKVSVVIPVYNVKPYLERCVKSVLRQTHKDLEIILVDDGSTDGSGALCDTIAAEEPCVLAIHQQNQGAAIARNRGIHVATGEYIFFLDSDDEWLVEDGVEILLRESAEKCDMAVFNMVDIWKGGAHLVPMPEYHLETISRIQNPQVLFSYLVKKQMFRVTSTSVMFRRSLLIDNNILFPVAIVAEDLHWSFHVWQVIKTVSFHNLFLYGWHHRPGSITQTTTIRNYRSTDYVFSYWEEQCNQNCVNKDGIRAYLANRWFTSASNVFRLENAEKKEAIGILNKHKDLLQYALTPKAHRTFVLVKMLGVKPACVLLGVYRQLKLFVKRQLV